MEKKSFSVTYFGGDSLALLSVMASGHGAGTCSVLLMFFLWSTKCQKERDGECVSVWWSLASRRATALMAPSSPSQFLKSACQHLVGGVLSRSKLGADLRLGLGEGCHSDRIWNMHCVSERNPESKAKFLLIFAEETDRFTRRERDH